MPLPLMGGEWLRSVFCRLNHGFDFLKWDHSVFPAISPYLWHSCMAGYPYLMPMASAAICFAALELNILKIDVVGMVALGVC